MMIIGNLQSWFSQLIMTAKVHVEVKPYVAQVLAKPKFNGLEAESIVLAESKAISFAEHQNIGDFALWSCTFRPGFQHEKVIETCGRISYDRCYLLLGKRIKIYEQLADEFGEIVHEIRRHVNTL